MIVLLWGVVALSAALISVAAWRARAPAEPAAFASATSLDAALHRAAASGRPVLVLATAGWCPPCQRLKRGALSDPAVTDWVRSRTEPVVLDIDRDRDAAMTLGIMSIPTLVVMRDGSITAVRRGDAPAAEILSWLEASTAEPGPTRAD